MCVITSPILVRNLNTHTHFTYITSIIYGKVITGKVITRAVAMVSMYTQSLISYERYLPAAERCNDACFFLPVCVQCPYLMMLVYWLVALMTA